MKTPEHDHHYDEIPRGSQENPNNQLIPLNPIEQYMLEWSEESFNWLHSPNPTVIIDNHYVEVARRNHFEDFTTEHLTELANCSIDHLPHTFPQDLGSVTQILILLQQIYTPKAREKVTPDEFNVAACAWLRVLVTFENGRTFITDLKGLKEGDVIPVLKVDGLRCLARDSKDTDISFCQLKEMFGSAVLLGPPELS